MAHASQGACPSRRARRHRCEPETGAEPDVAEPRDALQVRVTTNSTTGIGHNQRTTGSSWKTASRKTASADPHNSEDLRPRERAGGELAIRRARVPRVDLGVDETVQGHRERPRADHRDRDPDHVARPGQASTAGTRPRRRTATRTRCARSGRATRAAAAAGSLRRRRSRLAMRGCGLARASSSPCRERGPDDLEPVAAAAGRPREG